MRENYKQSIAQDLMKKAKDGKLDEYEFFAVLDGVVSVYNKIKGEERKEDLYEAAIMSRPQYDIFSENNDKKALSNYIKSLPKDIVGSLDLGAKDVEQNLAVLILKMVDLAVEKDYKESKKITIPNNGAYRADMEGFEEAMEAYLRVKDFIKLQKGEDGLKVAQEQLAELAKHAISTQRNFFAEVVDYEVKLYAKIELAREQESTSDIQ